MIELPDFLSKKELFDYLHKNKARIIAQKKANIKHADAINAYAPIALKSGQVIKSNKPLDIENLNEIKVRAIINTTKLIDSHMDMHVDGLWKKSLQENKMIMHLQEHVMKYDHIISEGEDLKAYTKEYDWKDLGFDFEGTTQGLVFDSLVKRSENEFMFRKYASGKVKNHSVGMQYVKMLMAVNDDDYPEEKMVWDKYYDMVANKEVADEFGYFFPILEAKVIEGSAVPLGSNWATPTENNNLDPSDQSEENEEKSRFAKHSTRIKLLNQRIKNKCQKQ
jgi:hypothetical protein